MASKKNRARSARDASPRKFKKKTSVLVTEKVEYVTTRTSTCSCAS